MAAPFKVLPDDSWLDLSPCLALSFLLADVLKLRFSLGVICVRGDALLISLFCFVELPKLDKNVAEAAPCLGKIIHFCV